MPGAPNSGDDSPRSYTLPRSTILRGRSNFDRLFSDGSVLRGSVLNLRYLLLPSESGICQMGFIVGKRHGNAVKRNRCKRRMREAYRLNQHLLTEPIADPNYSAGFHGALMALKIDASFQSIEQDTIRLLSKIRSMIADQQIDK